MQIALLADVALDVDVVDVAVVFLVLVLVLFWFWLCVRRLKVYYAKYATLLWVPRQ